MEEATRRTIRLPGRTPEGTLSTPAELWIPRAVQRSRHERDGLPLWCDAEAMMLPAEPPKILRVLEHVYWRI